MELLGLCAGSRDGDLIPAKSRIVFPQGVWFHNAAADDAVRRIQVVPCPKVEDVQSSKDSQRARSQDSFLTDGTDGEEDKDTKKEVSAPISESERWMWWRVDAILETTLCPRQFVKSLMLEVLPIFISVPMCLLVEGRQSMFNRSLLPDPSMMKNSLPPFIFQQLCVWLPWIMLTLWLVCQPSDVHVSDVCIPFALLLYRSTCIALKYSYFSPSDMQMVQRMAIWRQQFHSIRSLGVNKFFNLLSLILLENSEQLVKSIAFLGLQNELQNNYFTVKKGGHPMWTAVKEQLELSCNKAEELRSSRYSSISNMPLDELCSSKYPDPLAILGLGMHNIAAIDRRVRAGELPVSVVMWYFVSKYKGTIRKTKWGFNVAATLSMTLAYPIVKSMDGRSPFGESTVAKAIFGIRVFAMYILSQQPILFIASPVVLARRHLKRMLGMLACFQQEDALALKVCSENRCDVTLEIACMADLKAFWILNRVLGPTFDIGFMTRYNSAFIAASVGFLLAAVSALNLMVRAKGTVLPEVIAEITIMFVLGSVSVILAALLCMRINGCVNLFSTLARKAALLHPELGGVAKDVVADFSLEHSEIRPVQLMYMSASPGIVSFFLSGMILLAALFISLIPAFEGLCVPFLITNNC